MKKHFNNKVHSTRRSVSRFIKTMPKVLLIFVFFVLICFPVFSQGVAINSSGNPPNSKALLDIDADATTKTGLLVPRMTTAERNTITTPIPESLLIYNTTTQCFEAWNETSSTWVAFGCIGCQLPGAFAANAASSITTVSFVANWSASAGASTYYLDVNTSSDFTGTWILNNSNVGNVTTFLVSSLTCETNYYYRLRASNDCGITSNSNIITFLTSTCGPQPCGAQVFLTANLNVGTMVTSNAEGSQQINNALIEKYCYNNISANCDTYGGLYEWAEAMALSYTYNAAFKYGADLPNCDPCTGSDATAIQGICPVGYHIPTDLEWSRYEYCLENTVVPTGVTTLNTFQTSVGNRGTNSDAGPGAKMKVTSSNTPAWDGTNTSGFSALPGGSRVGGSGLFTNQGSIAYFWSATERVNTSAWNRALSSSSGQSERPSLFFYKTNGLSVRCLKN
ncbi:MAG: FISUMP domain-containing protein [Bacteroidales bacterium]|nr:FISUMP domain-containing protein [Bacteroidales bacterium]MDD4216878.1 FISUMP domain-containing protein [Bacteroidales bacterium]MDY0143080.1 FISUMP domain-containing protein [Bacteroidales bacterium]